MFVDRRARDSHESFEMNPEYVDKILDDMRRLLKMWLKLSVSQQVNNYGKQ
ncbi:MAG: hypothetical protein WC648_02170 [Candidatus Paceibacterota bacterium]